LSGGLQRRERGRRRGVPGRQAAVPRHRRARRARPRACRRRARTRPGRPGRGGRARAFARRGEAAGRMTWLVVGVGLLLLVFLHELGHFLVALAVGMRPRSFYVGFPPALFKVRRNGIEYGIGMIPLGGLVRIPGMHRPAVREDPGLSPYVQRVRRPLEAADYDGARAGLDDLRLQVEHARLSPSARRGAERALRDVDEGTGPDAYWRAPTWKRIAVIAAGPLANVLVAFLIFTAVYATGAPTGNATTRVAQVEAGAPAEQAGLRSGDTIGAVNGKQATTFPRVSTLIRSSKGAPITVTVRRDGKTLVLGP